MSATKWCMIDGPDFWTKLKMRSKWSLKWPNCHKIWRAAKLVRIMMRLCPHQSILTLVIISSLPMSSKSLILYSRIQDSHQQDSILDPMSLQSMMGLRKAVDIQMCQRSHNHLQHRSQRLRTSLGSKMRRSRRKLVRMARKNQRLSLNFIILMV